MPLIELYSVAATGNIYAGLYYPMIVSGVTLLVGSFLLKQTNGIHLAAEATDMPAAADLA